MKTTPTLPSERHGIPANSTRSGILDAERQNPTKHTPGPYAARRLGPPSGILEIFAAGAPIAKVYESAAPFATKGEKARAEATARLLAAAPALLIELKNTVAAIEKWGKEHPESGGWIGVIHGALKAIAQAEGGAQ